MLSTFLTVLATSAVYANAAALKTCPDGSLVHNEACCPLLPIVRTLQNEFFENECGENVHESLRLTFHDAIGFSLTNKSFGGGADGSIHVFEAELSDPANAGVDEIVDRQKDFIADHNITLNPGDFIQLAGAVGLSNCRGAPRLQYLHGRPPPKVRAAVHAIPEPTDSVTFIINRFADAGLNRKELVALLASHSVAAADTIDPSIPGTPFDTTPDLFDTQFFIETQLKGVLFPGPGRNKNESLSPYPGEIRIPSDMLLARDPRTACLWQANVDDQHHMMTEFKDAMKKMAVLGQDVANLIDCSEVIPIPAPLRPFPHFPAGRSAADLQPACSATPFPTLAADPGPVSTVAPVPPAPGETESAQRRVRPQKAVAPVVVNEDAESPSFFYVMYEWAAGTINGFQTPIYRR